jgi:hypothetical protein
VEQVTLRGTQMPVLAGGSGHPLPLHRECCGVGVPARIQPERPFPTLELENIPAGLLGTLAHERQFILGGFGVGGGAQLGNPLKVLAQPTASGPRGGGPA